MKLRTFILALLCGTSLGHATAANWRASPHLSVQGPTVVAFFPVTDADLKSDDTNEALSDFQYYLQQAERPLQERGIAVYHSYASSSI